MTTKKVQKRGASRKSKPTAEVTAEAEAFKDAAHKYAAKAYTAALAHYGATDGKTNAFAVMHSPWEVDAAQFAQYQQDGRFFAAILADPKCPEGFRRLFEAVWSDDLLGSVAHYLGGPHLLPLTYPVVRDVMDASNLCGTAEGIHDTLIKAVETLVPDEIADRALEKMKRGG
jgi:hypothetical protein